MEIFEIVTYFILLGLISTAVRVVTTSNVIHAAISLVFTLALTAILFLILSSEFVALVLVLVYIGAVIVLFLFGIMITRAPLGKNAELDNDKNKKLGAAIAGSIFLLFSYILINGFVDYENIKQAYLLNLVYLIFGIGLFYLSFLRARIKGTLINMGE